MLMLLLSYYFKNCFVVNIKISDHIRSLKYETFNLRDENYLVNQLQIYWNKTRKSIAIYNNNNNNNNKNTEAFLFAITTKPTSRLANECRGPLISELQRLKQEDGSLSSYDAKLVMRVRSFPYVSKAKCFIVKI
jgi:hypothetical protein